MRSEKGGVRRVDKPHKKLRAWQLGMETGERLDKKLIEEDKVLSRLIRSKKVKLS